MDGLIRMGWITTCTFLKRGPWDTPGNPHLIMSGPWINIHRSAIEMNFVSIALLFDKRIYF